MKNNLFHLVALTTLLALTPMAPIEGNNIKVTNVTLKGQNVGQQFTMVAFDLSWENSWRSPIAPRNWDAAWVFVKFRLHGQPWSHASLNHVNGQAQSDGHIQPVGATIETPPDGVGVFIYRSSIGDGDNDWSIQLRWNYGADGVLNNQPIEIKVFAIEMVYIPEGIFKVGGGSGNEIGKIFDASVPFSVKSYTISSESQITVSPGGPNLYYSSPGMWDAGDQQGPIPAQFPKGYNAFYCMKYEVSQGQWVDFFNTLSPSQQLNNDITDLDHRGPNPIDRNTIEWGGTGGAWTNNPYTPLSFPLWGETLAYMDWAGLRPMTELEFVKACRGPRPVGANEYAWGTNNIIAPSITYDLLNKNAEDEALVNIIPGTGNANWIHSAIFEDGPYRNGIFAASNPATDREQSGASYYGVMEMSGNLSEMAVTIGTPEGRVYQGIHGDGVLDSGGEANTSSWPPITGEGGGLFGGSWFSLPEELEINERRSATVGNVGYFNDVGFRCVRTAPE